MSRLKDLHILFLYFLMDQLLCGCLLFPLMKQRLAAEAFHAGALMIHLVFLIIFLIICWRFAYQQTEVFRQKLSVNLLKCLIAAGAALIIQIIFVSLLNHASITSANQQAVSLMRKESMFRYVFETLIYAPLCEELVFRHALHEWLKLHVSKRVSILICCIAFALLHVWSALYAGVLNNLLYLPVYALCAWILFLLKDHTGSIVSCVIAHMLVNLAVLVF